ncbi:ArsR family transcriptional regulator [Salinirubrum litoreum]|uniref:ArsR family transcriptional regulator n=1 Tax=Salinirubrum litoreum TaxID=1126234 RepID=A0ABD5RCV0_9EURY|nr:ArsR family transcriptional regulator [Salinirubrum litoreum]
MTNADDRILEFLRNEGNGELVANPAVIAVNIGFSPHTVRERVGPLRSCELIEYHDGSRGLYRITDTGRDYLDGRLDDDAIADLEAILDGH